MSSGDTGSRRPYGLSGPDGFDFFLGIIFPRICEHEDVPFCRTVPFLPFSDRDLAGSFGVLRLPILVCAVAVPPGLATARTFISKNPSGDARSPDGGIMRTE